MIPRSRRNACPTIAAPMETGDGLLARLPPAGPLSAGTLLAICEAARRFGNGVVEITARGSIQVRGLSTATVAPFSAALAEAGIVDRRPAIVSPPLAGLDPTEVTDVRPFVASLRDAVAAEGIAERLAPKTSVVVDGGGVLHLDAIDADLRLVATSDGGFHLAIGGTAATAQPVGLVAADGALTATRTVLGMIADLGPAARGRDLDATEVAAAAVRGGPRGASAPPRRPPAESIGLHALRDGTVAIGIGLPFGQTDAATLAALVGAAGDCGAVGFVPAPGRTCLAIGLPPENAARYRDRAASLGFIVRSDDPGCSVVACAGAPACAAGLMPARAVAAEVARAAAPMLDGSVTVHVSGCAKGCAYPRPAELTFVGSERGAGVVVAGRAGDTATTHVPPGDLPASAARLAVVVSAGRRPGERSADVIARLGADGLARHLLCEPADA